MTTRGLCICTEACAFEDGGKWVTLREGAVLLSGHRYVKDHAALFEPLALRIDYPPDDLGMDEVTVRIAGDGAGGYGYRFVQVAAVRTRPPRVMIDG